MINCNHIDHVRFGPKQETQDEFNTRFQKFIDGIVVGIKETKMGTFNINITAVGGHGCERKAKEGEPLYGRCGKFNCPDCMAYEFVQQLKQRGMLNFPESKAIFTHWPGQQSEVIDDMLANKRIKGQF